MTFKETVHRIVSKIPKGTVLTYQEVAQKAGSPKAYRAVASLMSKNFDVTIHCHRVIKSDGKIGQYNRGGMKEKIRKLLAEGVRIEKGKVIFN